MARTRIHGQQVTDGSIELVDLSTALASTISGKADAGNLAPVATSGSYNDLTNLPTLFSGAYADLTGKPTLFSGDYADLSNKPSLFDGNYSSLSGAPVLSTVATSGSYNDLSNLPTLFSGSYTDLTNKPILFSGSYNDLTNKPSIPSIVGLASETYVDTKVADLVASAPAVLDTLNELAAALGDDANFATTVAGQIGDVASDVTALDTRVTAAEGDIISLQTDVAGKADSASLALVATSGSYNDLSNLPTLFSGAYADLTGKPTLFSGSYNDLSDKPTFSSDLDGLTDVAITSPSADQVLKYNGTSWVNATAPATFSGSYTDLTNKPTLASFATLSSPSNQQVLQYNGTNWVNATLSGLITNTAQDIYGIKTFIGESGAGAEIRLGSPSFMPWAPQYTKLYNSGGYLNVEATNSDTAIRLRSMGDGFNNWNLAITRSEAKTTFDFVTSSYAAGPIATINIASSLGVGLDAAIGARFQVNTGAAATKGLIVKGAASQTANLLEVQNSSASSLFSVDKDGLITAYGFKTTAGGGVSVTGLGTGTSSYSSAGVHLNANQSAYGVIDLVGNNGGFIDFAAVNEDFHGRMLYDRGQHGYYFHSRADATPKVCIDREGYGTLFAQPHSAAVKGIIVRGVASQTANLFEAQNSSGTALFSIDKDGSMAAGSVPVARVTGLHAVATSGSYNDLSDKPSIPSIVGLASETYVDTAVAAVVNSAPAVLDTLNELAAALGDDPNFATTMTTALASKADTSSLAAVATSGSYVDLSNKPTIYTPVKEVFTALVDGTETEFVLSDAPAVAGTEQVFVNGLLQSPGAGDDYTISGATITFNTAPESGWKLVVYYFV